MTGAETQALENKGIIPTRSMDGAITQKDVKNEDRSHLLIENKGAKKCSHLVAENKEVISFSR